MEILLEYKTMWVATDKNGEQSIYSVKPEKYQGWYYGSEVGDMMGLCDKIIPSQKWPDEPVEFELVPKGFVSELISKVNNPCN